MIDKLLQTLIDSTSAGNLKWSLYNSMFNSETSHRYEVNLTDGTNVYTEISLDRDLKYKYTSFVRISQTTILESIIGSIDTKEIARDKKISQILSEKQERKSLIDKLFNF